MAITRTQIAKQLLAQGGRIGFQGGGKDASQDDFGGGGNTGGNNGGDNTNRERGIMSRGKGPKGTTANISGFQDTDPVDYGTDKQNAVQYLVTQGFSPQQISKVMRGPTLFDKIKGSRFNNPFTKTLGKVGLYTLNPSLGIIDARKALQAKDVYDRVNKKNTAEISPTMLDEENKTVDDINDNRNTDLEDLAENVRNMDKVVDRQRQIEERAKELGFNIGGRVGLMEGGMPYEGGIMDLESARQMYGLGKLVKKVTRTVKKIAKSPIGKAALLYTGAGALGNLAAGTGLSGALAGFTTPKTFLSASKLGSIFSGEGIKNILFGSKLGMDYGVGGTSGLLGSGGVFSPLKAITATSLIAGALTPKQEEEAQRISDETGIDIQEIRANPDKYLARRFRAEGGSMKEPVAKKTMPLLDMDGQEMDLRAEGGFVPIGRMEKADDVPARLSKNEFVFTADAVRNAGDGSVDKGAEVMYNMMKNLEAGGDVSEESQGLEGARKMFQTSQRLEEVL